jgi:hypothetical protein
MPQIFKDSEGREWDVGLPWDVVRRLKDKEGINLLEFAEDKFAKFREVMSDPLAMLDLLWAIVKPQAEAKQMTRDQFEKAMGGDALYEAQLSFEGAYLFFTHNPKTRSALKRLLEKQKAMQEVTMERLVKVGEEMMQKHADLATAKIMDDLITALSKQSAPSGASQAS